MAHRAGPSSEMVSVVEPASAETVSGRTKHVNTAPRMVAQFHLNGASGPVSEFALHSLCLALCEITVYHRPASSA